MYHFPVATPCCNVCLHFEVAVYSLYVPNQGRTHQASSHLKIVGAKESDMKQDSCCGPTHNQWVPLYKVQLPHAQDLCIPVSYLLAAGLSKCCNCTTKIHYTHCICISECLVSVCGQFFCHKCINNFATFSLLPQHISIYHRVITTIQDDFMCIMILFVLMVDFNWH